MKNRISFSLGLSVLLIAAASAHAQSKQTWVSGVGDDFNPCSRTAPCKTFAGATSKTAAGGEISVLDPGDFGAVTITKSITINGDSTLAGILVDGTDAVIVRIMAPIDNVILRGLSINGGGTGLNGIRYLGGGTLVIEDCRIYGFTQAGIHLTSTTGAGTLAQVTNSLIAGNTDYGVHAEGNGTISIANSLLTNNGVAVQADAVATTFATVRLSNNEIFDNKTDIGCGGGTVASWKNNKIAGIVVRGCAPNLHLNEK
jgi:parallel beta helix pectate lyase-like protein